METAKIQLFSWQDWFWAARPKTLTTAIVPFLAGTSLASALGYSITWYLLVCAWLSAICIQVGTNFINDAFDFARGSDTAASLGPVRATRAGMISGRLSYKGVRNAGLCFFFGALIFGIPLVVAGGVVVGIILLLSILAGYSYTGGPFPLAYHGLGDLFVIVFYGFVATNAAFWLQTGQIEGKSLLLSMQIGSLCTSMIAINNLRDVHEDVKAAKNTLPVRFGILFGKLEVSLMLCTPLLLNLFWPWNLAVWLPFLSAPLACKIISNVWMYKPGRIYNNILAISGANMLLFTATQAVGFIWG